MHSDEKGPVTWGPRVVGSGVPALPWKVSPYGQYGEYEGHSFVTADPKGMARSVCNGFADDMEWVARIHNAVIAEGWRARLARRLMGLPHPASLSASSPLSDEGEK